MTIAIVLLLFVGAGVGGYLLYMAGKNAEPPPPEKRFGEGAGALLGIVVKSYLGGAGGASTTLVTK